MKAAREVDVLVVGFGAAGANAAIAAHDAGARVLVLEKLGVAGGNSAVSAGAMVVPSNLEAAIEYYRGLAAGTVSEEVVRALAEGMVGIPDLLTRMGVRFELERRQAASFPSLAREDLLHIQLGPTGQQGFRLLEDLVRKRGIEVSLNTKVQRLIQRAGSREVLGVEARRGGEDFVILARKGVVLSCGGYGYSPELLASFNFPGVTRYIFPCGSPGNTGDGLRMASEAGAALWHMAAIEWGQLCAKAPSEEFGTAIGYGIGRTKRPGSYLFVNQRGRRFMAEDTKISHRKAELELLSFDHSLAEHRNLPAFLVFDEKFRRRGPIAPTYEGMVRSKGGPIGYSVVHELYDWSHDNRAEIERGWILQAESIAELAGRFGSDGAVLEDTIDEFNRACAGQSDSRFGRSGRTLVPVDTPPYFAVELGLSLVNTQGGPKRNVGCQVLDYHDVAIPRLFAAGELGSFFGFLYQGGSNLPEAWAFGHVAGRAAAAEVPWEGMAP